MLTTTGYMLAVLHSEENVTPPEDQEWRMELVFFCIVHIVGVKLE